MGIRSITTRASRRLLGDERGGMAVMGAVLALPLMVTAFAAVEYHNITTLESDLQRALDAASLAVARSPSNDEAELDALGEAVLLANLSHHAALQELESYDVDIVAGVVTSTARLKIKPIIARMLLPEDIAIQAKSEVKRGEDKLEVVLVLDNTGSMGAAVATAAGTTTRIALLKQAATEFVTRMETAASRNGRADAVKMGLVPFSHTVNVGTANASATWLDRNAIAPIHDDLFDTPGTNRWTLLNTMGVPWGGCVESRSGGLLTDNVTDYDLSDTPPVVSNPASLFVPYFAPDEPDYFDQTIVDPATGLPVYYPVQTFTYPNNYLMDVMALNTSILRFVYWPNFVIPWPLPAADPAKQALIDGFWAHAGGRPGAQRRTIKYRSDTWLQSKTNPAYGPNAGCALQPIVPLTSTLGDVRTRINQMTIGGSTNIPFGLVWGWHVISPYSPFTAKGANYNTPNVTKVVVLMTDGENALSVQGTGNFNRSTYSGVGYVRQNRIGIDPGPDGVLSDGEISGGSVRTALDNRLTQLCANMKGQNVVIYTIGVEVATQYQGVLRSCATDVDKFFDARNAAQMSARFEQIAESILNLHISN